MVHLEFPFFLGEVESEEPIDPLDGTRWDGTRWILDSMPNGKSCEVC